MLLEAKGRSQDLPTTETVEPAWYNQYKNLPQTVLVNFSREIQNYLA